MIMVDDARGARRRRPAARLAGESWSSTMQAQGGRRADQRHHARRDAAGPSRCAAASRSSQGRNFAPGLDEVIVGDKIAEPRRGPRPRRGRCKLQKHDWKIVGVFASRGRRLRERDLGRLRRDRPDLPAQRRAATRWCVRLKDRGRRRRPSTAGSAPIRRCSCRRVAEQKYYEDQAGPLAKTLRVLATVVAVIMGIGAVFGAMNTMYAIVAARTREIGTLRALGFSRRAILFSLRARVGDRWPWSAGAIGCLLAFPMNGFSTGTGQTQSFSEIAFAFRITPGIVVVGIVLRGGHGPRRRPAARAARGAPADHVRSSRDLIAVTGGRRPRAGAERAGQQGQAHPRAEEAERPRDRLRPDDRDPARAARSDGAR